ncbi:MAG TPA: DpnII family type II restriction endonuclease [Solirubrobacterales bacterium]
MTVPTFEEYLTTLSAVAPAAAANEPEALELCVRVTEAILALEPIDRASVTSLIASDPETVVVLAAIVGLSQERLKTWLQSNFDTAGWVTLGRQRPNEVVEAMDRQFGLISLLAAQSSRDWTWADVLARGMSSRQRAGSAIAQGRALEDEVEAVIEALGLELQPRTRFEGTGGATAPADFALPRGGADALVTVAVKGFDSTGSKLTDARREIEEMAKVRKPTQFIFAIVDGHGWLRRKPDLRRIHALWDNNEIDGLYTRASLGKFDSALQLAARRVGISD